MAMKGSQEEGSHIPHPPTKVFLAEGLALSGRGLIHGVKALSGLSNQYPRHPSHSTPDTLPTEPETPSPQHPRHPPHSTLDSLPTAPETPYPRHPRHSPHSTRLPPHGTPDTLLTAPQTPSHTWFSHMCGSSFPSHCHSSAAQGCCFNQETFLVPRANGKLPPQPSAAMN